MKQFNYGPGRNPENTVVHCPTKELAQKVLKVADTEWIGGGKMYERDGWDTRCEYTCYSLTQGKVASYNYYVNESYDIMPAEEFLALNEEFTLPEKWAVRLDFQEAVDYANENGKCPPYPISHSIAHFPAFGSREVESTMSWGLRTGYTLLTKEQFLQHVWKEPDAKERNPFKNGDRIFCAPFGYAIVKEANYAYDPLYLTANLETGKEGVLLLKSLCSFTEYALQGFSQERPENKRSDIKVWEELKGKGASGHIVNCSIVLEPGYGPLLSDSADGIRVNLTDLFIISKKYITEKISEKIWKQVRKEKVSAQLGEPKRPEIKKGQLIYVRTGKNKMWFMSFFKEWNRDGLVVTYLDQKREGNGVSWPEYSLTNPLEEASP